MEILNKNDKKAIEEYESFVCGQENASFMQSIKWAGVKANWKSEAVIVRGSGGKIEGSCLVLIKELPLLKRTLLYAPRGPVCDYGNREALEEIFEGVDMLAKSNNAYEFICDPPSLENNTGFIEEMEKLDLSQSRRNSGNETIQCRNNYMLDIRGKTPDEIMSRFKSDWRNRIRKAVKKGVYCKTAGAEGLKDFYPLMEVTGKRDKFPIRSPEYFKRFMEEMGDCCKLFICCVNAEGREIPLSAAIAVKYAGTVSYVYGASSNEYRNLYPNYLMQWKMINWGLESGCSCYDFGGIPCYREESSPKYGIYRFKKGFGGEIVNYTGEFVKEYSFLLSKLHNIYCKVNFR